VNNFDTGAREKDLADFISGLRLKEKSKRIPNDRETRALKGFMFLEFENSHDAN